MLMRYFSKFLTDIMPPVVATVIGAWIVTHYINPKSAGEQPKTEASVPAKPLLNGASGMTPRAVESVSVKPTAGEQPDSKRNAREKAATEKAAAPSKEAKATPQSVVTPAPRAEERRDATDLARAALERLRQDAPDTPRTAPAPVVATPAAAPVAPAPAMVATPAPVAIPPAPALPPPVVITAPRDIQPVFEASSRPIPPADIPNGDGLATGSAMSERASDNPSLFGGLKSAAKSLVDTVIPR